MARLVSFGKYSFSFYFSCSFLLSRSRLFFSRFHCLVLTGYEDIRNPRTLLSILPTFVHIGATKTSPRATQSARQRQRDSTREKDILFCFSPCCCWRTVEEEEGLRIRKDGARRCASERVRTGKGNRETERATTRTRALTVTPTSDAQPAAPCSMLNLTINSSNQLALLNNQYIFQNVDFPTSNLLFHVAHASCRDYIFSLYDRTLFLTNLKTSRYSVSLVSYASRIFVVRQDLRLIQILLEYLESKFLFFLSCIL